MGLIITKLSPKKYAVMKCYMQVGKITTNSKVKIDFALPELSMTNIFMLMNTLRAVMI